MKTKKWITILTAVLLLVSLAGCAASNSGPAATGQSQINSTIKPTDTTSPPTEPTPEKLTKEQAEAIALEHAGLTADEVTFDRTEYEVDDGRPEYEIEFRSGNTEYDYTIHAQTGKVLEWDKESEPEKNPEPSTPTESTPKPTEPAPEKLTKAQAEAIALEHAGLTAEQVKGLESEYDIDDGVPEYSVEFYADGWEYDYEIHAENGKILEWDKDFDD